MPSNWNWHQRWKGSQMTLRIRDTQPGGDQSPMGLMKIVMIMLAFFPWWKVNYAIFIAAGTNTGRPNERCAARSPGNTPRLFMETRLTTEFSGRQVFRFFSLHFFFFIFHQKEKHMSEKWYNRNTNEMMPLTFKTKKASVKVSFNFYHGLSLYSLCLS